MMGADMCVIVPSTGRAVVANVAANTAAQANHARLTRRHLSGCMAQYSHKTSALVVVAGHLFGARRQKLRKRKRTKCVRRKQWAESRAFFCTRLTVECSEPVHATEHAALLDHF